MLYDVAKALIFRSLQTAKMNCSNILQCSALMPASTHSLIHESSDRVRLSLPMTPSRRGFLHSYVRTIDTLLGTKLAERSKSERRIYSLLLHLLHLVLVS